MKEILLQSMRLVVIVGGCAALTGCSPFFFLNAAAPEKGFSRQADIAYGPLSRQKLDVYTPEAAIKRPFPVVVFFFMAVAGKVESAGITVSSAQHWHRAVS
jgi:hypothetical protein